MSQAHRLLELAASANNLADALEAAGGGGRGLRHKTHAKTVQTARASVQKVLQGYFARQEVSVLAAVRPRIQAAFQSYPVQEAQLTPTGRLFANAVMPDSLSPLRFPVTGAEASAFGDAVSAAIAGAAATFKADSAAGVEAIAEGAASRWLRDNSLSKLTGDIAAESVSQLRGAITDAWEAGGSYNQVVAAVKDVFGHFSDVRAGMIAQTEINEAYNFSRAETAAAVGFDEKAWDPDGEACEEICQPNVDEGYLGIDESFGSGDDQPPAHPNCDCSLSFRKSTGAEDDE